MTLFNYNRENPAHFENQIKPRVYVKYFISTKKLHFVSRNCRKENDLCSSGFNLIKIHLSDYLKSLIRRIMKYMYF